MFDDLLVLMKGGNTVFFGELGQASANLVNYFEGLGAEPIEYGENPAAWMLRAYAGNTAPQDVDFPEASVNRSNTRNYEIRSKLLMNRPMTPRKFSTILVLPLPTRSRGRS